MSMNVKETFLINAIEDGQSYLVHHAHSLAAAVEWVQRHMPETPYRLERARTYSLPPVSPAELAAIQF